MGIKLITGAVLIGACLSVGAIGTRGIPATEAPATPTSVEDRAPTINDLAPLAGAWRCKSHGHVYEEIWLPPSNGQMTGTLRSFDEKGELRLLELITLTETDDGLEYRLRHFDGAMKPWASESEGPLVMLARNGVAGRADFDEVIGSDSLAGASIDLTTPGSMVFTLRFAPSEGETEGGQFELSFARTND